MRRIVGVIGFALLLMGAGPYQDPYYQGSSAKYGPFPTADPPSQEKLAIPPSILWDMITVLNYDRRPRGDLNIGPTIYPQYRGSMFPPPQLFRPWYLRPYPPSQVVTPGPAPRPLGICTHVGNNILCN